MSASLCPGFKQVDTFGPDDNYEDEEVTYVTLDLGNIEPTLVPSSTTYRLIGLDTPTPFLQLSGTILKGRHDTLLGTELLFTDRKDPHEKSKRSLTHVANTEQRIRFNEVRLQPKSHESEREEELPIGKDDTEIVDRVAGKLTSSTRVPRTRGAASRNNDKGKGRAETEFPTPDNDIDERSDEESAMDIYEG